ncbi:MAG: type II toxin-antitoxin system VapB family antitoxin [Verrucomicrobiia bacterium]
MDCKEYKNGYIGSMKTTIDIPKEKLKEIMKYTKAQTKKEAVLYAIEDFNRRQRLAKIVKKFGTFKDFMTLEELYKLRGES